MPVPRLHAWQPPEKQIPDKVPSILEGGSVKPDAIHLRGSSGEAIYVPLQAYEDFEKFLKERVASSAPALPRNVLDSIEAVCRLKEGYVDIDWKARLQVTEGNLGVSRIPLGMSNQNLIEAPAYQKGVQSFLRLNPAGGYDWWLYAEGAKSYEIQFRTRMKVQVNGNLSTLRFSLVDAPCQISIDLPGNNQQIQASGNGIPVVETEVGTDVTKATIFGVGGNLTVSWKDAANTDSVDSIEVESSTKWDLAPDARAWSGTTRFLVRTFGRKRAKEFQIKLPPGMRWSPQKSPRWEDSVELTPRNPEKGAEGNKEEGEALRVRLTDESNEAPIELTVAWDWNRVPDKSGRFQLMGPICEGVQRHEGRVELNVPSGLNLGWNSSAEFTLLQQDRVNEPMPTTRYLFRFNDPHYRFSDFWLVRKAWYASCLATWFKWNHREFPWMESSSSLSIHRHCLTFGSTWVLGYWTDSNSMANCWTTPRPPKGIFSLGFRNSHPPILFSRPDPQRKGEV